MIPLNIRDYFLVLSSSVIFFNILVLPIAQAANGSIEGYVKDEQGNPVSSLYVDACTSPCGSSDWILGPQTDSNGHYTLTLPAGTYKVHYYTAGTEYAENWYNNQSSFASSNDVTVTSGGTTTLNNTTLTVGGSISGSVTNGSAGIGGILVYAYNTINGSTSSASTDSTTGQYTITGLATGDYTVQFFGGNTGYTTEWYDNQSEATANTVHVDAPNDTGSIDAVLDLGRSISGYVTISETGLPLSGALVNVCDSSTTTTCNSSNPAWKNSAITGTDGSYTVGGLSASSSYKVQFFERMVNNAGTGVNTWYNDQADAASADPVSIDQIDVDHIDAVFDGASISGTVKNTDDVTLEGIVVKAYDSNGNMLASSAPTGMDGTYTIFGLPRGAYKLYFQTSGTDYAAEWYNDAASMSTASAISITSLANALTGKDAVLALNSGNKLAPIYNLLLLKKRCRAGNGVLVHCNCLDEDGKPAYCQP